MRAELAQLTSEEFYLTELRLARVEGTFPVLVDALAELHIEPQAILLRAVRFPQEYERRRQTKQLTYQNKRLAQAEQEVEIELQETGTREKEIEAAEKELRGTWDKKLEEARAENAVAIARVRSDAQRYDRTTRAEADADQETMLAEGKLAIDKAEALRSELRNRALDTEGGAIFLARQAAEKLTDGSDPYPDAEFWRLVAAVCLENGAEEDGQRALAAARQLDPESADLE